MVAPVWNIIYSFGLLMGIGGSVLFSTIRGKADGDIKRSNEYFTASVIGSVVLAAIIWLVIILFDKELLVVFGAQDNTLTLAREYVLPIKFAIPFFLFNQMLAAYLRNDKDPALATGAVLAGGIFNIFGDYFFVFTCDMGAFGAGLATAIGSTISFLAMLSHFSWSGLARMRCRSMESLSTSALLYSAVPTVWGRRPSRSYPQILARAKAAGYAKR